jgi:transposase
MIRWAPSPTPRLQTVLIPETLDELVAPDHDIRVLDRLFDQFDWRPWEIEYERRRGQPPIHPKLIAGTILYGVIHSIRSSRDLEEATRERLDLRWFLEGRMIDHSTFAAFRTKFDAPLKDLALQFIRRLVGETEGGELLALIADGTRIRANSDRHGAKTAKTLEKLVAAASEAILAKLETLRQADLDNEKIEVLNKEVEHLRGKIEQYKRALEVARQRDAVKKEIRGEKTTAVRVPVTDPDSTLLPNKEGGYAPNYTPVVAIDAKSGAIVVADIAEGGDEAGMVETIVAGCEQAVGKKPDRLLADGGFAAGENLQRLENEKVEAYMPPGTDFRETNPAVRPDPTEAVPADQRDRLPRNGSQLNANAFVYDPQNDCFYCPEGKTLPFETTGRTARTGIAYRRYGCPGSEGCPLASACVRGEARRRTVARDEYQDVRDRTGRRMATAEGRAIYAKRSPIVEGSIGVIKAAFGVRQFLLRGMKKVKTEWLWICGASNLQKLLSLEAGRLAGEGGEA